MGLRGPPPKRKDQRARVNTPAGTSPQIDLVFVPGKRPDLPTMMIDAEGNLTEIGWCPLTLDWWADWSTSPQSAIFSVSDWRSLLATAFVAQKFFTTGEVKYASELRQREAAFGATPLDRMRLKMAWSDAAEKDEKRAKAAATSVDPNERYAGLHAVPDAPGE